MQLAYLTRVDIGSPAAQARQIQCMARAFYSELGADFLLVSSGTPSQCEGVPHRTFLFAEYPRARYFGICLTAALRTLARHDQAVFTRDIAVAAVVAAVGGTVIYEAHKEPMSRMAHYLTRTLARSARFRLVAISGALSEYYSEHYGIPPARRLVAHDGVFPYEYQPLLELTKGALRTELELPLDKKIVVHTGSLYKGGAELFGNVVRGRDNILFIHVGGSAEECRQWEMCYRNMRIDNIQFIAYQPVEQIRKYQVAADLLFYISTRNSPIYWCTSPLKLFEYMASGTPILGACIGSVSEILNDSNAFCFDPDEPETLEKAFARFESDPEAAARRAMAASELVKNTYSWGVRANRIITFASVNEC